MAMMACIGRDCECDAKSIEEMEKLEHSGIKAAERPNL